MKGKKILIVEDEVVFRSVLRNYLKSFDVITYTASGFVE
nr:response regulator [Arsenophonus endosymbiont of Aphis craccivora]